MVLDGTVPISIILSLQYWTVKYWTSKMEWHEQEPGGR